MKVFKLDSPKRLPGALCLIWPLFLLAASPAVLIAQDPSVAEKALQVLHEQGLKQGLSPVDLSGADISDTYQSTHNGVTHVFFQQHYAGIPVFNAINGVHLDRNGQLAYATQRFFPQLESRIRQTVPARDALSALITATEHLDLPLRKLPVLPRSSRQLQFEDRSISRSPVPIQLWYLPMPDSTLRLAWQVGIHDPRNADYQVLFVDAESGNMLDQFNRTIYCTFHAEHEDEACEEDHAALGTPFTPMQPEAPVSNTPVVDQASYLVFPLPVESPIHGAQTMAVNPADPVASPFGWHDTNGIPGPEFTVTRGNNIFAYLDRDNDDAPDGPLPDGGPELIFDFPFNPLIEPIDQPLASLTQLFFLNNAMHDFAYRYGFDEVSGNFQTNNYRRGGRENDAVLAQAHDGGGTNNANFLTLPDGDPGVMQMYFWTPSNAILLRLDEPSNIAGAIQSGSASFGPIITSNRTTARVVAVSDSLRTNLACSTIFNTNDVRGNIALISRGTCTFKEKVLRAEQAGAIGVIIANTQEELLTMGGDNNPPRPQIPSVLIRASDAQRIFAELSLGKPVSATIGYQGAGTALRDVSFDNGITAHEYAHGISNRLTSGPSRVDCLFNDESMSEGWSDFFTLVTTVNAGQTGKEARGLGNYVLRQNLSGNGIRRRPYSTNFQINNQVYKDIIGTRPAAATTRVPHPVGEIWAATLWDLYWAMSDQYGWDPDKVNGNGGNNKAIQLVMDGMKLQPCNPGFLDGRDAILAADRINYNGENRCLIWEVFARRGLGFSANQGSTQDRNDGIQAFDIPPTCGGQLVLRKSSTPVINAGDTIRVSLTIINYKSSAVSDLVIEDALPASALFVPGSLTGAEKVLVQGNTLRIEAGALDAGSAAIISYRLLSDPAWSSQRQFFDNMENGPTNWKVTSQKGDRPWSLVSNSSAPTGRASWNIPNMPQENDHALELAFPVQVSGEYPVLRFFHRYNTQTTYDGGVVEISTNGGNVWNTIPDSLIFRQPYVRPLFNNTFGVARINGFSGPGPGAFQPSYIDLSSHKGKTIHLRFRFASNEDPASQPNPQLSGWFVDNVELMDAARYVSQACLSAKEGDRVCAITEAWGTIVEPGTATSIKAAETAAGYRIFPNPATEMLYIQSGTTSPARAIALFSADGRKVKEWPANIPLSQGDILELPLRNLAPGLYFLHLRSAEETLVEKVVVY